MSFQPDTRQQPEVGLCTPDPVNIYPTHKWENGACVRCKMPMPRKAAAAPQHPGDSEATVRSAFEKWITSPPYERDADRFPMDESKTAWPGQYRDITVEVAWEAWCEAKKPLETPIETAETQPVQKPV